MPANSQEDEIEVEVVTVFKVNREAWANEYGVDPGTVQQDMATYYVASELKEALEDLRPFGPLVTKLSSMKVRIGKGPRASLSES